MKPRALALLLLAVAGVSAPLEAQPSAVVRTPGPGPVGRRVANVLAAPHRLVTPGATRTLLSRDSSYHNTIIVLGRDVVIETTVQGDVIVIGGDAFVHPGANVEGRVVAIGGGAYGSTLAVVRDGLESHRDFTFDVTATGGGFALDYRALREHPSPVLSLPGVYGVRIPSYDRSDGLSLPFAPLIALDTGRYEIEPALTYRTDLGAIDPSAAARITPMRSMRAEVFVGRSTFTNERWIWSDLVNSAATLGLGVDTRNYYRADRAEATLFRLWQGVTMEIEPYVGLRAERDREVGPDSFATSHPWSMFGSEDRSRMRRPNPAAQRGTLQSIVAGARWSWDAQGVRTTIDISNEGGAFSTTHARFVQTTLDGEIRFPTFRAQLFWLSTHVVHTFGDAVPPQRWSYLGGAGTIPTVHLLSLGGDRLIYVESNYYIPVTSIDLRFLGSPSVTLRHVIGSAGVGRLPAFEQNVAARLALSFARAEITVDPARREVLFGAGLSFTR